MQVKWLQFFSAALLVLSAHVYAQETPVSIVSATSEAVRTELLKENGSNTDAVRTEVEKLVHPRFDFARMSASSGTSKGLVSTASSIMLSSPSSLPGTFPLKPVISHFHRDTIFMGVVLVLHFLPSV